MRKNLKYTPGPWEVKSGMALYVGTVIDQKGREIHTDNSDVPKSHNKYNARLISAAPELAEVGLEAYEILKECMAAGATGQLFFKFEKVLKKAGILE